MKLLRTLPVALELALGHMTPIPRYPTPHKGRLSSVTLPLVAVLLLWSIPGFGQVTPGQVRGRVTDETGGALPGVTVELGALTDSRD